MTPDEAAELAGKLVFLSTTMYGRVGRAQMKPIYGRQYSPKPNNKLTHALTSAMRALLHIVTKSPPRVLIFNVLATSPDGQPIIYADAFFELGDKRMSPGNPESIPYDWRPLEAPDHKNGWGAVLFLKQRHFQRMRSPPRDAAGKFPAALTMRGEVPSEILRRFCSRRAYIYFLEAWAQCIAIWAFATMIQEPFLSFCDNEASKHALIKGYGKDEGINALLTIYWQICCTNTCDPWIERVSSKDNPSDGVSRDDFTLADEKGWHHIEINVTAIWPILLRAIDDEIYAVTEAPDLITSILAAQLP